MRSVGMPSAYMAVSDTRATSAASLSGFSATYFAMEEPPISSSPSTRKRMLTGSVPVVVLRAGIGDEVGGAFDVGAVFGHGADARNAQELLQLLKEAGAIVFDEVSGGGEHGFSLGGETTMRRPSGTFGKAAASRRDTRCGGLRVRRRVGRAGRKRRGRSEERRVGQECR